MEVIEAKLVYVGQERRVAIKINLKRDVCPKQVIPETLKGRYYEESMKKLFKKLGNLKYLRLKEISMTRT